METPPPPARREPGAFRTPPRTPPAPGAFRIPRQTTPSPPRCSGPCGYLPTTPPGFRQQSHLSEIQEALLEKSAPAVLGVLDKDPDAAWYPGDDSRPPLCFAAQIGCSVQLVQFLLDRNADVEVGDASGATPLHILCGRNPVAPPLFIHGVYPPSTQAMHLSIPDFFADPVSRQMGRPPKLYPEQDEEVSVARLLLQNGASPEARDLLGRTPLELARSGGHHHLLELFESHAAPQVD